MKWLNFIKRKAPMLPIEVVPPQAEERDELAELQTTVSMHQGRLAAMETEAAELGNHLCEIGALSPKLKIRISEHDAGAAAQLDAVEREEQEISRRREGLLLRITALQAELAPLVRQASELAAARDLARQDALVTEISLEKERLIDEILSHWARSCEAAYALMVLLDGSMSGAQRLDEEHKRAVFAMNTTVGVRIQAAALVHVNEQSQFQFARSEVFHRMRVIPAKRRKTRAAAG